MSDQTKILGGQQKIHIHLCGIEVEYVGYEKYTNIRTFFEAD